MQNHFHFLLFIYSTQLFPFQLFNKNNNEIQLYVNWHSSFTFLHTFLFKYFLISLPTQFFLRFIKSKLNIFLIHLLFIYHVSRGPPLEIPLHSFHCQVIKHVQLVLQFYLYLIQLLFLLIYY